MGLFTTDQLLTVSEMYRIFVHNADGTHVLMTSSVTAVSRLLPAGSCHCTHARSIRAGERSGDGDFTTVSRSRQGHAANEATRRAGRPLPDWTLPAPVKGQSSGHRGIDG